tara:strand:- start:223 stop:426 length:204 start_codon:yes stop_codon:yes gene_type:complete
MGNYPPHQRRQSFRAKHTTSLRHVKFTNTLLVALTSVGAHRRRHPLVAVKITTPVANAAYAKQTLLH